MNYSTEIAELKALKETFPCTTNGRVQYTNEFKARVVRLAESSNKSALARELGVNECNMWKWANDNKLHAFKPSKAVAMSRKQHRDDSPISILERQRTELAAKMVKVDKAIQLLRELGV